MNIEQLKQTSGYKRQRRYVVCDCGKIFKNRYAVQSLHDFVKETKYFSNQKDAIEYYNNLMERFTQMIYVRGKYVKKKIRNIQTGQIYNNMHEVEVFYNLKGLSHHLNGRRKEFAGYQWEFINAS